MKRFSGLMALVALFVFGPMSTLSFADEEKKGKKDKGGQVVFFSDEKKDDKKDQGGT